MLVLCDNQSHQNYKAWIEEGEGDTDTRERDSVHIPPPKKIANVYYPNSVQNFLVLKCRFFFQKVLVRASCCKFKFPMMSGNTACVDECWLSFCILHIII